MRLDSHYPYAKFESLQMTGSANGEKRASNDEGI